MIAPLTKFIDWSLIQAMTMPVEIRLRLMARRRDKAQIPQWIPHLEETLQFLKGPDFLPSESQPARVEFHPDESGLQFCFPTPRPSGYVENNTVWGRLYRCGENWQELPVIVLLHGGYGGGYRRLLPRIARRCNRAGFNAATLEGPYQLQRRPRQPGAGSWNSSDQGYMRLAETMAQGVAEIRALIGWLLAKGCPAVALWGLSLGGTLAGITACCDARPASVVMAVPGVRHDLSLAEHILWPRLRTATLGQRTAYEALNQTSLNLTTTRPCIPKENILLLEAIHDLCVGSQPIEDLWQVWGRPEIWRLPRGHITFPQGASFADRVIRWLAPRLEAGQKIGV